MSNATARKRAGVELTYILGRDVVSEWEWVKGFVEPAVTRDPTVEAEDIFQWIAEENALCWVVSVDDVVKAVAVTRDAHYPSADVLEVVTLGGEGFSLWCDELQAAFEAYVEMHELDGIRAYCRPGMAKFLKRLGWVKSQEIMSYGRR